MTESDYHDTAHRVMDARSASDTLISYEEIRLGLFGIKEMHNMQDGPMPRSCEVRRFRPERSWFATTEWAVTPDNDHNEAHIADTQILAANHIRCYGMSDRTVAQHETVILAALSIHDIRVSPVYDNYLTHAEEAATYFEKRHLFPFIQGESRRYVFDLARFHPVFGNLHKSIDPVVENLLRYVQDADASTLYPRRYKRAHEILLRTQVAWDCHFPYVAKLLHMVRSTIHSGDPYEDGILAGEYLGLLSPVGS